MPNQPVTDSKPLLDRALSPFEHVFWRLAQAGSLNVTTVATVDGPLSKATLEQALRSLQRRHPLLRVRVTSDAGLPRFEDKDMSPIPLRAAEGGEDCSVAAVQEEINDAIDASRGPLVRCTWVREAPNTHHLLLTFHHAIGDGMSGVFMMRDLLESAAELTRSTATKKSELNDATPMDLRLPRHTRGPRGVWNQLRFVAGVTRDDWRLKPPARPVSDDPTPLAERRTTLLCRILEAETVNRLARITREQQTTVHGALSAAIILATVADSADGSAVSVKHRTPVNMRPLLEPCVRDDVGMFASMAFFRGRVMADDNFWNLARNVRAGIKTQIEQGVPATLVGMLPRIYQMIRGDRLSREDLGIRWQERTPSTTGLTNLGRISVDVDVAPFELRKLHFAVSPGALGDCASTATTYGGRLYWNFVYASPFFSDARTQRITEDAVARLHRAIDG